MKSGKGFDVEVDQENRKRADQKQHQKEESTVPQASVQTQMEPAAASPQVALGDIAPNDLVCMANNDYMGQEQLEVEVDGKIYYGCCEMYQERLPIDESVRVAIDPISQKEVDKVDAVIAVTGERGKSPISKIRRITNT